ncbi:hypothetical protein Q3G72_032314 [Acer saccharum]|nr:hypothetical protein Q3G72_032314 [Acer saccharum]
MNPTKRNGEHIEATESDNGSEVHVEVAAEIDKEVREGRESQEIESREGDREREHGWCSNLCLELHPQVHQAEELPPSLLLPRRHHCSPRYSGQDDYHGFKAASEPPSLSSLPQKPFLLGFLSSNGLTSFCATNSINVLLVKDRGCSSMNCL